VTTKSDLLRVHDVRDAYRLIGECRDLGNDPVLWQQRMFDGLRELIGAPATSGGEGRWRRPHGAIMPTAAFGSGFDEHGRAIYSAYMRELTPARDPVFSALQSLTGGLVTRARRQLVSDTAWYRSVAWCDYHRPARIDDRLTSVFQVSDNGLSSVITVHRAAGERGFSPRELRLLSFFHGELGPLVGRSLVSATESSLSKLTPRVRQTLACLIEGDSEKQAAARLGVSPATIHQYVTTLYRHFGVRSRAQLLALVFKRLGQDGSRRLLASSPGDDLSFFA
jgi:DNA-binding CsgD family transcriptional regulator